MKELPIQIAAVQSDTEYLTKFTNAEEYTLKLSGIDIANTDRIITHLKRLNKRCVSTTPPDNLRYIENILSYGPSYAQLFRAVEAIASIYKLDITIVFETLLSENYDIVLHQLVTTIEALSSNYKHVRIGIKNNRVCPIDMEHLGSYWKLIPLLVTDMNRSVHSLHKFGTVLDIADAMVVQRFMERQKAEDECNKLIPKLNDYFRTYGRANCIEVRLSNIRGHGLTADDYKIAFSKESKQDIRLLRSIVTAHDAFTKDAIMTIDIPDTYIPCRRHTTDTLECLSKYF